MSSSHPTPDPRPLTPSSDRRGVVLLVVLGMVALVALLGISFVTFSGQDEASSRARSDFVTKGDPPSRSMDRALDALLNDTREPTASIRGHSLLRDLWGNDVVGRYVNVAGTPQFRPAIVLDVSSFPQQAGYPPYPVPGPERFNLEINLDPSTVVAGTAPRVPEVRGYLNGRELLFKGESPLAKQHATIVSYEPMPDPRPGRPPDSFIALVRVSPPLPTAPRDLDEVLVLQRPFNGTGDRDFIDLNEQAAGFPLYPPESQNVNFVYNNRDPETRRNLLTGVLREIGGFDEPWDMADLQNLFLAALSSRDLLDELDLDGDGSTVEPNGYLDTTRVILPSFYRPVPPADWTTPLGGGLPYDPRRRLLRPRPIDQVSPGPDGIIGTADDNTSQTGVPLANPGADTIFGTADDDPTFPERVIQLPFFLVPDPLGTGTQVLVEVGPGQPVPANGIPVDVDNDGDGMLDSMWVDAGLPIETRPDGTRAKPLVAYLVVDEDGKLNLNVHGNHAHNDIANNLPYREVDRNADGTMDTVLVHGSNLGASPSEINLGRGLYSKVQDGLDNNGDGFVDDMNEFELLDALNNDSDGATNEIDESELLAILSGSATDPEVTYLEGRHGEMNVITGLSVPPRAGRTSPNFIPQAAPLDWIQEADDDHDMFQWRRFGSTFLRTREPVVATIDAYHWLGNPETTGFPVRDLFGLPDFDGDGYDQLRPWHMTWWGTIRNPEDNREAIAALQRSRITGLSRWASFRTDFDEVTGNYISVPDFLENVNEGDELNAYQLGPYDAPYSMTDLEWLLRGHDLGGERLESRLGRLAPLSFWSRFNASETKPTFPLQPLGPARDAAGRPVLSTDGFLRRRLFTTQSWDLADYGLMPDVWRNTPPTGDERTAVALDTTEPAKLSGDFNPRGETLPLGPPPEPLQPRINPHPGTVTEELVMPPDLAAGKRLNLNFPLGDGLDNSLAGTVGEGIVDEPTDPNEVLVISDGTPLAQYAMNLGIGVAAGAGQWQLTGFQLRELQAHQLYALLRQIAYPADDTVTLPGPTSVYDPGQDFDDDDNTPFEPGLLGQLAQLAVNIVDFRDPDNFPTRFDFGGAGAGSPQVVYGVERPGLVINETMIYLQEVDNDNDGNGDPIPQFVVGTSGLWVELYNPNHPDRPVTTAVDLTGYRLVLAKDLDNDNRPDLASAQTFQFPPPPQPNAPSPPYPLLEGGKYLVAATEQTANGTAVPEPFVIHTFDLTPVAQEFTARGFIWKIFLQRATVAGEWVTVDQSRLRIWVRADPMITGSHAINEEQLMTDDQLVSRERREPFRGGPDSNAVVPPGRDLVVMGGEFEYNDVSSPAGVPGGSAVRSHPNRNLAASPPEPSHSLGFLNWHSDVDDQNGDRKDVRATTLTKPLVDTNGDMKADLADLDGDLVNYRDAAGAILPLNPQGNNGVSERVPTVAWPPIPFDDPMIGTNYLPSRAVGFDFLPWLDRDYANVGELLLVPGVPASNLTALFHPEAGPPGGVVSTQGGRYAYLADFFEEYPTGALGAPTGTPRGLYRLFEFVEVPSRQRGATDTSQPIGTENRNRRVTGKLNLNTIQDPLVYEGLIDDSLATFSPPAGFVPPAPRLLFEDNNPLDAVPLGLVTARNGADLILGTTDDQPFVFGANGFEAGFSRRNSLLRTMTGTTSNEALFTLPDDFGNQIATPYTYLQTNRTGEYRNPWFKQELLRKISSQVTTRSNVFAVWVTVGYFEVLEEPSADGIDNDQDGLTDEPDELVPRLGRELGSATGQVTRHRAFYVIDRTRSVGFDPELDPKDSIIYRRIIE